MVPIYWYLLFQMRSILTNFEEYKLTVENFVHFHLINEKHNGDHYKRVSRKATNISK